MSDYSRMRINVAKIAELTLPSRELDCKAFELIDLQGYMELADAGSVPSDLTAQRISAPLDLDCLGTLSEPSAVLQLNLDAS